MAIIGTIGQTTAQCTNQLASWNPNLRTMTANDSRLLTIHGIALMHLLAWFIVPISKSAVLRAVQKSNPLVTGLSLLDVPASELPGFQGNDLHPVLVQSGWNDDIRLDVLQIWGALFQASVSALYVSKDGSRTPLQADTAGVIGATDSSPPLGGLVPALVSTLFGGTTLGIGNFKPTDGAYQTDINGVMSANSKVAILPNPLSGPGVELELADMVFTSAARPKYTLAQLKRVMNQPVLLNTQEPITNKGKCILNTYYLNNATANPQLRTGNVTLGPGSTFDLESTFVKAAPDGGFGHYLSVDGMSACAQVLGSNPLYCDDAGEQIDPAAL
ncbi:hypothetical protein EJ05DRAFT_504068 [Pseudovirgaria hyperparasitica]|uniref:Uncharacterized protein n=1 Tax=Pseudovirgaria hyperparasitica TaxID=470096 RepID=A0A6A6VWB5_9PEZI|nr:uncharacterized protein EJ05DRAFT_504068 [Pseudovirgaria hyperparasitica]KAF2754533.1 hypothetical protein EJ05DRAFT_504068 [Pseudovirgaria hyperparasitica]